MTPRPYQLAAMGKAREAYAQGSRAILIVSPTGSGKTFMGSMFAHAHLAKPGRRVVWTAHRTELIDQAAKSLHGFGLDVSVRNAHPHRPVQIESVQTILARGTAPEGTLFVPDEAHHFADSNQCGTLAGLYPLMLGLTATPERGDGKPMGPPFTSLVVAAQISELVALWRADPTTGLVPLRIRPAPHKLGPKKIAQTPVDSYIEHARGMRAICFAPNLTAAESYRAGFEAAGVSVRIVSGKTPPDDRAAMLEGHANGRIDVLVNCGVLTEGYDDPGVQCVIIGRGCGSQGLWLQMVGRGLRPYPGKEFCVLIDLRGVVWDLGRPDADREFSLEGEPIKVAGRQKSNAERICKTCHAPLGDLVRCPECFAETALTPESAGLALVDFEDVKIEVKERLKPNKLVTALAGMMRKTPEKGAIMGRFRAIFKRVPDDSLWKEALRYNVELKRVEANMMQAARER